MTQNQQQDAEVMGLRKDQQSIQSKRSLLKSGTGSNPTAANNSAAAQAASHHSQSDKQSPMMATKKASAAPNQNMEPSGGPDIKLPTLNPTKNSIASHS